MNILMLLVPKGQVDYLFADFTVRQALEKMSIHHYSLIPVIDRESGVYVRSLSEGDLLYYIQEKRLSFEELEKCMLSDVPSRRDIKPVGVFEEIKSLYEKILGQNFVPIIDNRNVFIGIVTRKAVFEHLMGES